MEPHETRRIELIELIKLLFSVRMNVYIRSLSSSRSSGEVNASSINFTVTSQQSFIFKLCPKIQHHQIVVHAH